MDPVPDHQLAAADESWARSLLRRGWDLTWKVAVVGAAATAAPVLAPPVVLLSAASLALSVPFAAYLASLAATDRLMAALLPTFPTAHSYAREDDDHADQEFLDASEEPGDEDPVFRRCCTMMPEEEDEGVRLASLPMPLESFQESSVSRNGDQIENGTTMEEKESTKETVALTSDVSEFLVPMEGVKGNLVEEGEQDEIAVQQLGQYPIVLETGDKSEESTAMEEKESTKEIPPEDLYVSGTPVSVFTAEDNVIMSDAESEVVVEVSLEEVASNTDIVTTEMVDMHVENVAIESPNNKMMPLSDLMGSVSQAMGKTSFDGEMQETAVMEGIVRDLSDANIKDMQHHDQEVVCSSISAASPFAVHDREDAIFSGNTQDIPGICDEVSSQADQGTGFRYTLMKEEFGAKVESEDKHLYTEAQLWEQLETVRTITGYRSPPSSTLVAELAGMYLFVGVEPPVSSRDASDLKEINAKLRLLKSIIGVD
uniref:Uncharacterized protein n=1 Tax=Leersia perrieri TaxID=77586 RepID=A0A0D9XRK7_9ORYZ